jgi:hypothetical protein
MNHHTFGKIVDQVSDVLWSKLLSKHLIVPDYDRFLNIALTFRERWNFLNVIGCIGVKHIRNKCPTKAERIVRCICLLHNIITDLEETTHDHSVLQITSQIRGSRQSKTNVTGRSFSWSKKGATDVRNAFNAYFNGHAAASTITEPVG